MKKFAAFDDGKSCSSCRTLSIGDCPLGNRYFFGQVHILNRV